jgi:hypothetical protein
MNDPPSTTMSVKKSTQVPEMAPSGVPSLPYD